ncbi:hypothetical protein DYB26_003486 [Aphanomyces astaci]|uniref:Uncharacterized protein n=1 Tax=Aphanomyces astaci TaxID=112090 RepID=A0A3R6XYN2_APHAT|nr:hypothetical protein DYB34_010668 [Aphanomyces astaci]RHZ38801.1 hypothetical protein DYB26_003486 [Aphanomyces astaci]
MSYVADEQIEKLLAEKKQLEQEIRRQSQQFRQVLEERDADVQVMCEQQLVVAKSKEVTALQAQFHALEAELARPAAIKRKADALDGSHEYSAEAVAQEKKHLQDEIDMLMETDLALRDKVEQEAANVAASVAALSGRLQTQLRVLASSSSTGALLTRLYTFIVSHDKDTPIAMADVCPSPNEGVQCIDLLVQVGVVVHTDDRLHLRQTLATA